MSESDELPSWAASATQTGSLPVVRPPRWRRRVFMGLVTLAVLTALAGTAALGYWYADSRGDDTTVASDDGDAALDSSDSPDVSLSAATAPDDGGDEAEADSTTTTAVATTTSSTSEPEEGSDDPAGEALDNRDGSIRHAVFKDQQVILRGKVPSQDIADEIATKAAAVVGPGNVIVEYEIDPEVPASIPSPLYVEDVVLFDFNSVAIEPAFLPILDLGTLLLTQNPTVTITVVARTDATGPEAINQEVSEQRAQAVIDYWVRHGIEPDRLIADARGETDASEDEDEQAAALNRRAEFVIEGLLG
jgi:outer membrane protein OmpA-like peptidoglycan-associated protein